MQEVIDRISAELTQDLKRLADALQVDGLESYHKSELRGRIFAHRFALQELRRARINAETKELEGCA